MAKEGKPIGNIRLGVSLDGTELSTTIDQVNQQLKVAESSMKANLKVFDKAQNSYDALAQKQKDLTDVTGAYDKKVDLLTQRLKSQESAENRNEKAIANTKKQLNDAIAKQSAYAQQLDKTKQEIIYVENGVNDLKDALKQNEKAMNDEVKALSSVGDKAGAAEAKMKGLATQSDLLKKSIKAQENVVDQMAKEFGESSTQVEKAEKSLQSLKNQSSITEKQLDGLKNETRETSEEFKESSTATEVFQGSLLANFATAGIEKVKDALGSVIENLNESSKQYNELKAQLGSGVDISKLQGSIQSVFKDGFGDDLDEIKEAMVQIKQMMPQLNGKELESMTEGALAFTKATGLDMNESIRGAISLMENFGLTSTQAFDLMNKGAQNGLNRSGELADNLTEYGQLWAQNGFSAEQMFAILDNGLRNGAFNLDKVNDFVKEFGVSLSDGRIEENLGSFSQGTQELFAQFKEGKATSQDVFNSVINDLKGMTNEQDQATLASNIWSALGEDNSLKVIKSLNNTNEAYKNVKGTTDEVNNAIKNSEPFEALKRNVQGAFTPFSEKISGLKSQITDLINNAFENFPTVSSLGIGALVAGIATLAVAFIVALVPAGIFSNMMAAMGTAIGVITSPIALTIGAIALLVGAFVLAYQNIKPFKDFIDSLLESIRNFAEKVYNEYIKPALDEVVRAFNELSTAIKTWWDQNGAQFLAAVQNFFSVIWALIQPALQMWSGIFGSTFRTIVDLVKIGWDTIKGVFSGTFTVIKGLLDIFIGVFTGDWSKAWNGVKSIVEGVWKMITSGFEGFVNGITRLAGGIGDAIASGIGGAVNGVIDAINWVLDKLGADKIGHVSWGGGKKYAKGTDGHTGGNAIVNDGAGAEMVQLPNGRAFIPEGRNVFIPNMPVGTRVFTAEQTAMMFGKNSPTFRYKNGIGNFIGDVWQSTKEIAGKAWNGVKDFTGDILDFIGDPIGLLKNVFADFANFGDLFNPWLGMAKGGVNFVMDSAKDFLTGLFKKKEAETPKVNYNPTAGVEQWRAIAKKALQMEGQYTEANLTALLYQMQTESGGNPNAINDWDINAINGVPSQGLLQVIPPTFRTYARPGYDKSLTDPLSNILASIRYAVARYGSLTAAYRGVGYANGGFITKQHLAMVGEGNKPEVVIPLDKAKRSRAMQLLAKTKSLLGDNEGTILQQNVTTDTKNLEEKFDTMIQLMTQLLAKDNNTYLDGKKVNKQLEGIKKDNAIITNKRLGLI
ncbi:phage tail tape measure protein [Enterococcus sp. LJL99]